MEDCTSITLTGFSVTLRGFSDDCIFAYISSFEGEILTVEDDVLALKVFCNCFK